MAIAEGDGPTDTSAKVDEACKAALEGVRGELLHAIVVTQEDYQRNMSNDARTVLYGQEKGLQRAVMIIDKALAEGRWRPGPGW